MSTEQDVWDNIEKSYEVEFKHHQRLSDLNISNTIAFVEIAQAQMLGMFLLGEAEVGLISMPEATIRTPSSTPSPASATSTSEDGAEAAASAGPMPASV